MTLENPAVKFSILIVLGSLVFLGGSAGMGEMEESGDEGSDAGRAGEIFPGISSCRGQSREKEYERNIYDCSSYFMCDGDFYKLFQCPPGLHFDPENVKCDWMGTVNCEEEEVVVKKTDFK